MPRARSWLLVLTATVGLVAAIASASSVEAAPLDGSSSVAMAEANRLAVGARQAFDQAKAAEREDRLLLLRSALAKLRQIVDLYPTTDKAKTLAGGKEVAGVSIPALESALVGEVGPPAGADLSIEAVRAVADCDRLAADPLDRNHRSLGVWAARIDATAAVNACAAAVSADPNEPRLAHQYGRALDAVNRSEKAFAQFKRAAEQGYPAAKTALAMRYIDGNGVAKDEILGLLMLKEASDAGEGTALTELGELFWTASRFVSMDQLRAIQLYRKAALAGNPQGMLRLGRVYRGWGDGKTALFWIRKAAALGSPDATFSLATMLRDGIGTPVDLPEAVRLMKAEAEAGNAAAQNGYAILLDFGYGVAKDQTAAIDWYEKAAKGGSATAHYNLILAYAEGRHVKKDLTKAADHALEAIRLGNAATVEFVVKFADGLGKTFVSALQTRLKTEGLLEGAVSGTFDGDTKAALEALLKRASPS